MAPSVAIHRRHSCGDAALLTLDRGALRRDALAPWRLHDLSDLPVTQAAGDEHRRLCG